MLTACNISFLKAINYIEVPKYLFGINGLSWLINRLASNVYAYFVCSSVTHYDQELHCTVFIIISVYSNVL